MSLLRKAAFLAALTACLLTLSVTAASATTIRSGSATGPSYSGSLNFTLISHFVLSSSYLGTVTCTSGAMSGTTNSSGGASISAASFSNCSNSLGSSCTVTTSGFNWPIQIAYSPVSGGRDGTVTVSIPSNAISISCGGLGPCTYGGSITGNWYNPDNPNKPVSSNSHAQVQFGSVPLTGNSLCGNATLSMIFSVVGSGGVDLWLTA